MWKCCASPSIPSGVVHSTIGVVDRYSRLSRRRDSGFCCWITTACLASAMHNIRESWSPYTMHTVHIQYTLTQPGQCRVTQVIVVKMLRWSWITGIHQLTWSSSDRPPLRQSYSAVFQLRLMHVGELIHIQGNVAINKPQSKTGWSSQGLWGEFWNAPTTFGCASPFGAAMRR